MDQNNHTTIAVIGAGSRGRRIVSQLLKISDRQVTIASVYDPDRENIDVALGQWESRETKICASGQEAIGCGSVDWVMIFTPNVFHKEYILAGFGAGKHVFCEKPLATTLDDCVAVCEAHRRSGLTLMTGFVLRYSMLYRKIKELLDSGRMGKLLNISASENRPTKSGGNSMQNWRRFTKISGPYMLEKCCHDLDLLNWFTGSLVKRVAGFGSLDMFVPENQHLREKYGEGCFVNEWHTPERQRQSPFTSEKDIKDNHAAVLEFRNGVKVTFQLTLANAIPERRMYISCTEGTIISELFSGQLTYRCIGDADVTVVDCAVGEHGGGDVVMMNECYETMQKGGLPKTSSSEGLECAVTALAIDEAMNQGTVVDLEPTWQLLGR